MPNHRSKTNTPAWRARREEYLRASGRQAELAKEGFEPQLSTGSWAVIAGGRPTRLAKPNPSAALVLMKKVGS